MQNYCAAPDGADDSDDDMTGFGDAADTAPPMGEQQTLEDELGLTRIDDGDLISKPRQVEKVDSSVLGTLRLSGQWTYS